MLWVWALVGARINEPSGAFYGLAGMALVYVFLLGLLVSFRFDRLRPLVILCVVAPASLLSVNLTLRSYLPKKGGTREDAIAAFLAEWSSQNPVKQPGLGASPSPAEDLMLEYEELKKARAVLNQNDPAAVSAYNERVRAYEAKKSAGR